MEKEANQLYRRPQMTGQARDEEEEEFGGMGGASTTDALVEMIHRWSEATDKLDHYVIVALLDFSKVFDLINHNILHAKLKQYDLPPHIRRFFVFVQNLRPLRFF